MYQVLFLSHGELAVELLRSAELIIGEQPADGVQAIGLQPGTGMEDYQARIEAFAAGAAEKGGVLILVDLAGGSPFITAAQIYQKYQGRMPMDIVTGMNLSMAIEVLSAREGSALEEGRRIALEEGGAGIQAFSQVMQAGNPAVL